MRTELGRLVEVLSRALRKNPSQHTRIRTMRTDLARVGSTLRDMPWPLTGSCPRASQIVGVSGRRGIDRGFASESLDLHDATLMASSA
ncbi:hypothetical protein AKJ09_11189 [Labilithrix luteola]|uniref:Uncharacterized protein n=1 Tax=Labilithrix luteola TaxID=1391654 RepID=A0A0K1QFH3_9BACT|nr:hypothetical protein [Labilithrix luteola]AKV04526.1 hypothetical protein AKJ09_11189 [Labilithrix luteola]